VSEEDYMVAANLARVRVVKDVLRVMDDMTDLDLVEGIVRGWEDKLEARRQELELFPRPASEPQQ